MDPMILERKGVKKYDKNCPMKPLLKFYKAINFKPSTCRIDRKGF